MSRSLWALGIGLALILVLVLGAALVVSLGWGRGYGWGMMGPGMMGPGMMGGWWGFGLLGPIGLLVLGVLIIGGAVWFVQSMARGGTASGSGKAGAEAPLDILKRRYAGGEISKEQFEAMRRTLES